MKYFVEILSWFIGQERLCYIDNYSRGTLKYSWKTFAVLFKTTKVWPSESFPVYGTLKAAIRDIDDTLYCIFYN